MDLAIGKFEKKYLAIRNNVMFISKFVAPYIYNLFEIKATHEISLFIMSKKAYIDMKQLYSDIKQNQNFLKIEKYWKEFTESAIYS